MSRIALVAGPDAGHALPALGVGAGLVRRGHHVRCWTGAGHDAVAAAHGIAMSRLPGLEPTDGDHDIGHRLWARAASMAAAFVDDLERWRPDLVVVDTLTRAGAFAAQLLDLPWAETIPHHLADPADDLPPVGAGRGLARTPLRRWDDRRIVAMQRCSLRAGAAQSEAAARELGLEGVQAPALRLVATLPGLERRRRVWPDDAHVVGPLALEPALPPLEPPEGDAPLVVVTDSTATGVGRSLARTAITGLRYLDVRVVVTTGHGRPRREPGLVVGRGPHGPLLAGAAVAISPGGGGFVSKAAAAGVAHVVVPLQGDQREAAARLADTGAGRTVAPWRLSPRTLRWAVVRQLNDRRAAAGAARLAEQAAALDPDVPAELIEAVIDGERPKATGPGQHLATSHISSLRGGGS